MVSTVHFQIATRYTTMVKTSQTYSTFDSPIEVPSSLYTLKLTFSLHSFCPKNRETERRITNHTLTIKISNWPKKHKRLTNLVYILNKDISEWVIT